ncbi:MAG: 6-bladed beta-propeller [Solirubrobacterales bacterium]
MTPVPLTFRFCAAFVLTAVATALIATGSASAAPYVQQRAWGVHGTAEGQFDSPQGVATVPGTVYVADTYNSRIQAFDPSGSFLFTWGFGVQDGLFKREYCTTSCQKGIPGQQYGQIHTPTGIAAARGYVYVADFQTSRIERFTSNGKGPVVSWGAFGPGNTQFKNPAAVAADSTGHVYVADTGNNRIKKFTSNGAFLAKWSNAGSAAGQVQFPWGIASDNAGNVYVADTYNNRVEKFSANGKFLAKWGNRGTGNGQFSQPFGIATDGAGNVYVADTFNDRIQKFSPKGVFLGKWGKLGSGKGQFRAPQDIAVDGQGHVYVADSGNDRIVKYVRTP